MQHAIWTIIVAAFMPYVLTGIAKTGAFRPADNLRTRDWQAGLTGWRQRAHWAHQNSFEVFPIFAVAATLALLLNPTSDLLPVFCWGFIGARIVYAFCYIKNLGAARSLFWATGIAASFALLGLALSGVPG